MRLAFSSLSFRVVLSCVVLLACGRAERTEAQGFAAPVLVTTGNQPDFVATADVNGDGIADLIFIDAGSNPQRSVTHVRLGDGMGGFKEEAVLETGGSRVAIGDLLGDGRIAIGWLVQQSGGGTGSALYIAEGDGKGNFTSGQYETAFPGSPQQSAFLHVAAGRTHDTGPLDLFGLTTAGNNAEAYSYQANLQAGAMSLTTLAEGEGPIAFADLNNDGHGDMLIVGDTTHVGQVFLGGGKGLNNIPSLQMSQPTGIQSVLLQDVTGDGKLDLIAETASGRIEVYAGNGDGTFETTPLGGTASQDDSAGDGGHLIAAADVNGDGILDLLTYTPLGVSVELGTASGNYTLQGVYPVGTLAGVGGQFAMADFNGDGALDVAMDAPGGIEILFGKPNGSTGCATPAPGMVVACPEPSAFEAAFTLTATGPGGVGGGDTGTVTFSIAGSQSYQTQTATLGAAPMVNGVATLMVSGMPLTSGTAPLIPGDYAVSGSFVATSQALAANLPGTHTINLAPSTVTLTPAPPSTILGPTFSYGQGVNGYVHFNVFDPAYPATGSWTQLSNGVPVAGCVDLSVTSAGGSSCPYGYPQLLDTGSYVFTEAYNGGPANGDPINASSVSAPYAFSVMPDITSVNSLISSLNPAPVGTAVTFTVTLTGNAAVPTGTVQFLDGVAVIGTGTLNALGQASFTISTLSVGTHPITAVYAATLDFNGATSLVLNQVITALPAQPLVSALTLTSSLNPSLVGQAVTFTAGASVPGPFPFLIQSGTITFLDGASVIGTGAIDQFGRATLTTSTLALGSHPITASYPGGRDAGGQVIGASVSAVLTQVVGMGLRSAPPGFTLTVTPNPVVLKPGTTGVELVTVASLSGFSQAVALGCTGTNSSNELGCTFVEATIPAGGGRTTLDLTTTAPYACGGLPTKPYVKQGHAALEVVPNCTVPAQGVRRSGWLAAELGVPMMAGLVWAWPKRRRRWARLLAVVMLAGLVGLSGCGNCSNLGTRPGSYSVTVTGTSGSLTQTVALKIEVLDP